MTSGRAAHHLDDVHRWAAQGASTADAARLMSMGRRRLRRWLQQKGRDDLVLALQRNDEHGSHLDTEPKP